MKKSKTLAVAGLYVCVLLTLSESAYERKAKPWPLPVPLHHDSYSNPD